MPGPRPTPTEIKKRRGSPHRSKYDREPKPPAAVEPPPPPARFAAPARQIWKGLVARLAAVRVLTQNDLEAIERYVELTMTWRGLAKFLMKHGAVGVDEKGNYREYPQSRAACRIAPLLLNIERELGMTPSARTRIQVELEPKRPVGRPPGSKKDLAQESHDVQDGPRLKIVSGGGRA